MPKKIKPLSLAAVTAAVCLGVTAFADEKTGYGQGVITDEYNRPVGAVQAQERYGELGARFIGENGDKHIYLTFDEGYENGCTAEILDILKAKDVSAVFYITYDYAKRNPQLVQRMADEGHTIGNHTYSHPSLPDCTDSEFYEEVIRLEQYVYDNFGVLTRTLRPPMGEFSPRTLKLARQLGYETVFWSFAYADWKTDEQPSPAEAYKRITSATHDGAIYLLHAVSKTNTAILGDVIDYWRAHGYTVTGLG